MSNLKVVLNEGETITSYRLKVEKRMRGRREDSTLASSTDSSLATVLVHSQTVKRKTVKKTPKVPTGYKPTADAQPRDNSLLKSVLSSFRSTLSTMASQVSKALWLATLVEKTILFTKYRLMDAKREFRSAYHWTGFSRIKHLHVTMIFCAKSPKGGRHVYLTS